MATISQTENKRISKGVLSVTWGPFNAASDAAFLNAPNYPDKTFTTYVTGANKWPAAKLEMVGSHAASGYTWTALNDSRGEANPAVFTTGNSLVVNENPPWIKIKVSSTTTANANRRIWVNCLAQSQRR